jgi:Trypsin-co-occurring domain 1
VAVRVVEVMLPNKTVALVRAADLDEGGQVAEKVGWRDVFDFEGVVGTLEGVAQAVRSGLEKVTPAKTTVEFGIELAVKNGKLTGLIVEGDAKASLKVTLEWGGQAEADGHPA